MKIPVLSYHATNISGNEYTTNDHIALKKDLELLSRLKINIISAAQLVKWLRGDIQLDESLKYAVLTFDDGSDLDYLDWQHPVHGFQLSFFNILNKHSKEFKQKVHATSFVIASPWVRKILEYTCIRATDTWRDFWWQEAEDSGILSIENHSWDHLHPTLDRVEQCDNLKGDFSVIQTLDDANAQIANACQYIDAQIKDKETSLFAYPYGDYNSYLLKEYFPQEQNRIVAAFSCEPRHVTLGTNIWKIPRYVCGLNWKYTDELKAIIL
jgi:peptidoglycan/xylan/chitin deacetylase (PgdA/CDA1 family)